MTLNPDTYIPSLQTRITNWYERNKWKNDAYTKLLRLSESLDIIRHDWFSGVSVNDKMLALNRKLLTAEAVKNSYGSIHYYRPRSAQNRANIMSRTR